jgi:hypothetical protein
MTGARTSGTGRQFGPDRTYLSLVNRKQINSGGEPGGAGGCSTAGGGSLVTQGFRQKLYLHRTCEPLVQIDFGSLAPNTLDPMIVGECVGLCGN